MRAKNIGRIANKIALAKDLRCPELLQKAFKYMLADAPLFFADESRARRKYGRSRIFYASGADCIVMSAWD